MQSNPQTLSAFVAMLVLSAVLALPGAAPPAQAQGVELTPMEIEIWDDPDFRRRFVESYIAETDLEPKPTTLEEVDVINKTLELMSPPKPGGGDDDAEAAPAVPDTPEQARTRLETALAYVVEERKNNTTHSVLIDFLIANLRLNIAMNLPEPEAPGEDADDAARRAYDQAFEAFKSRQRSLLQQALAGYQTCVTKHAKYRRAWRNIGIVSLRLEDYASARDGFAQVIQLGGGDPDTYGLLGYCYTTLDRHLPAESAYRMANLLDPGNLNWKMGLVRSFLLQKRFGETVALTAALLEDDPTNAQLWLFQANAYIGLKQIDKAAENYEILDGLGESSVDTVYLLANIYTNKGLYDTAGAYYGRVIEMSAGEDREKMIKQLLQSARVLSTRGAEARGATKTLVAKISEAYGEEMEKKQKRDLLKIEARIAAAERATEREAQLLEEVVKLDPIDGEALLLLGKYYSDKQEWDQAVFYFERAANLNEDKHASIVADALFGQAKALIADKRPAEAVPLLRRSNQIKPREKMENYIEAVEQMSR